MQQRLKGPSVWVQSLMWATLKLLLELEFKSMGRDLGEDRASPKAAEIVLVIEQVHGQWVEQAIVDGVENVAAAFRDINALQDIFDGNFVFLKLELKLVFLANGVFDRAEFGMADLIEEILVLDEVEGHDVVVTDAAQKRGALQLVDEVILDDVNECLRDAFLVGRSGDFIRAEV